MSRGRASGAHADDTHSLRFHRRGPARGHRFHPSRRRRSTAPRSAARRTGRPLEHRRRGGIRAHARDAAAAAIAHLRDPPRGHPRRAERHRSPLRALHARPRRGAGGLGRRRRRHGGARGAGDAGPRAGRVRRRRLLPRVHRHPGGTGQGGGDRGRPRRRAGDAEPPREGRHRRRRRSRSTSRRAPPATTSSPRRSTSRCYPDGAASSRSRSISPTIGSTVRCRSRARQYARDLAYLQSIGGLASTTRTAEQSTIAQFWYEDSPLGWNRITNTVVRQRGLDSWAAARAFALVNFALADGYIAGFAGQVPASASGGR